MQKDIDDEIIIKLADLIMSGSEDEAIRIAQPLSLEYLHKCKYSSFIIALSTCYGLGNLLLTFLNKGIDFSIIEKDVDFNHSVLANNLASVFPNSHCLEILLSYGDKKVLDQLKDNFCFAKIENLNLKKVSVLYEFGANILGLDSSGEDILKLALRKRNYDLVNYLINLKEFDNKYFEKNTDLLDLAIEYSENLIFKLLIDKGADPFKEIQNKNCFEKVKKLEPYQELDLVALIADQLVLYLYNNSFDWHQYAQEYKTIFGKFCPISNSLIEQKTLTDGISKVEMKRSKKMI